MEELLGTRGEADGANGALRPDVVRHHQMSHLGSGGGGDDGRVRVWWYQRVEAKHLACSGGVVFEAMVAPPGEADTVMESACRKTVIM